MTRFIRSIYDWTLRLAAHRHANAALACVAFCESIFFPVPPDAVLIPLCLANRRKSYLYATVCTVSSVLGGIAAYGIGYFLFEVIGHTIVSLYGMQDEIAALQEQYAEIGPWILVAKGFAPIPYKVLAILSGVLKMNLLAFAAASFGGRAIRFFILAALLQKFGAPVQIFIEKYLTLLSIIFLALVIGGFIALKYLV